MPKKQVRLVHSVIEKYNPFIALSQKQYQCVYIYIYIYCGVIVTDSAHLVGIGNDIDVVVYIH